MEWMYFSLISLAKSMRILTFASWRTIELFDVKMGHSGVRLVVIRAHAQPSKRTGAPALCQKLPLVPYILCAKSEGLSLRCSTM